MNDQQLESCRLAMLHTSVLYNNSIPFEIQAKMIFTTLQVLFIAQIVAAPTPSSDPIFPETVSEYPAMQSEVLQQEFLLYGNDWEYLYDEY